MKDTDPLLNINEQIDIKNEEKKIEKSIRLGFIFKVYSLLLIQLTIAFAFVFLANEIQALRIFILKHYILKIIITLIPLAIIIYFICKPEKTREVPINYILLFLFSLSDGYGLCGFTLGFKKSSIYFAMILTLVAVLSLSIFAVVTKEDFTLMGGTLFSFLVLLIVGIFINIFFIRIKILYLILNIFSITLFSFYIIYDTQLIIGNQARKFSEDDYILAVINLYLDIIIIFMDLLSLIGRNN